MTLSKSAPEGFRRSERMFVGLYLEVSSRIWKRDAEARRSGRCASSVGRLGAIVAGCAAKRAHVILRAVTHGSPGARSRTAGHATPCSNRTGKGSSGPAGLRRSQAPSCAIGMKPAVLLSSRNCWRAAPARDASMIHARPLDHQRPQWLRATALTKGTTAGSYRMTLTAILQCHPDSVLTAQGTTRQGERVQRHGIQGRRKAQARSASVPLLCWSSVRIGCLPARLALSGHRVGRVC